MNNKTKEKLHSQLTLRTKKKYTWSRKNYEAKALKKYTFVNHVLIFCHHCLTQYDREDL